MYKSVTAAAITHSSEMRGLCLMKNSSIKCFKIGHWYVSTWEIFEAFHQAKSSYF